MHGGSEEHHGRRDHRAAARLRRALRASGLLLVLLTGSALTLTASGAGSGSADGLPTDSSVAQEAERERTARANEDEPAERSRRERTREAFRGMSGQEAIAVAKDRHPEMVMTPAWRGPTVTPAQRLEYVSDHAARITGDGIGPRGAVVVSPTPLRARDDDGRRRPVDLTLHERNGNLRPRNPLVDVRIGGRAGDGITLARSGVSMIAEVDAATEATIVQDTAFYANAATDTDLIVKPRPGGAETSFHLRSSESPEQLRLDVEPGAAGRTLEALAHRQGVAVKDGDADVARISAPVAWDADGRPVELEWRLEGATIVIDVAHRDRDYAYPLLVDPAVTEWYDWEREHDTTNAWGDNYQPWKYYTTNSGAFWSWAGDSTWLGNGMYIRMLNWNGPSTYVSDNQHGMWYLRAPGTSKVWGAEWNLVDQDYTQSTCLYVGIRKLISWGSPSGTDFSKRWESCSVFYGWYIGQCYPGVCSPTSEGSPGNAAAFGIRASGSANRNYFAGQVGVVYVHLYDDSIPTVSPPDWTNAAATDQLPVVARDAGLGIDKFKLWKAGDPTWNATSDADVDRTIDFSAKDPDKCLRLRFCPQTYTNTELVGVLPDGTTELRGWAEDPAGNQAGTPTVGVPVVVKLDRRVPHEADFPDLPRAIGVGSTDGVHSVRVRGQDDVQPGVNAVSGVRRVAVTLDGEDHAEVRGDSACVADCAVDKPFSFLAGPTPAPSGSDDFAGSAGTYLENHAPDAGGAWIRHGASRHHAVITAAGRVRRNYKPAGDAAYVLRDVPAWPDYDVSADVHQLTTPSDDTATVGVLGRLTREGTSLNGYGALYYPRQQEWRLVRFNDGNATVLGTHAHGSALTSARVTLRMRGPWLALLVDGTVRARARDTQFTTTAAPGVLLRDMRNDRDTYDVHLDNFTTQVSGVSEGRHAFGTTSFDGAGNDRASTRDVVVDRTPPSTVTATGEMRDRSALGGKQYALDIYGRDAGTWPDIAGIDRLEVRITGPSDGGTPGELEFTSSPDAPSADHSAKYTFDGREWADGTYTVTVLAYDAAKDPGGGDAHAAKTASFPITVERQGPTLEVTGPLRDGRPIQPTTPEQERYADIRAHDLSTPIKHIKVWVDPGPDANNDGEPDDLPDDQNALCPQTPAHECELRYDLPLTTPPGTYRILVQATDGNDNISRDAWDVVVRLFPDDAMGLEEWWHYDTTETGGDTQAHVNLGTGNVVWHSTPVVNIGRGPSTVVNLTYNSQTRVEEALPGIGDPNPDNLPLGYDEVGQNFSMGISSLTRLNEPLDIDQVASGGPIELIDADGTHHVFEAEGSPVGAADSYVAPPGVEMRLRRWSQAASTATEPLGPLGPLAEPARAWAATRPDGVTYFFDQFGYQTAIVDRDGNTIAFEYQQTTDTGDACDALAPAPPACMRKLVRVVDAAGVDDATPTAQDPDRDARSLTLTYHRRSAADVGARPAGRLATITDHAGRVTRFTYGDLAATDTGYLTQVVQDEADGTRLRDYELAYEAAGDSDRDLTDMLEPRPLEQVVDPNGGVTDIDYEQASDIHIDPADVFTSRRVESIRDRRDALTRDAEGEPVERGTQYRFHEPSSMTDGPTSAEVADSRSTCDLRAKPASRTGTCNVWQYEFDGRERVRQIIDPRESRTTVGWDDPRNRPDAITRGLHATDAQKDDPATATMSYNANGLLLNRTDAAGTLRLVYQDHAGPTALRSPRGIDAAGAFVSDVTEHYTPQGNADGEATVFGYEQGDHQLKGRVVSRQLPDTTEPARTEYDGATGVVVAETDEEGRRTEFPIERYDLNGLPEKEIAPAPNPTHADQTIWIREYDEVGNLEHETDPRGPESADHIGQNVSFTSYFDYDGLDRLVWEKTPRDTADADSKKRTFVTRSFEYDANGNLTKRWDAENELTEVVPNAMDLPEEVRSPATAHADEGAAAREITVLTYDPDENLVERESPNGQVTSTVPDDWTTKYDYDAGGLLVAEIQDSSDKGQLATSYAHDMRGNVVGIADPLRNERHADSEPAYNATVKDRRRWTYEYDAADRRIAEIEDPAALELLRTLEYDANGNVTEEHDPRSFRRDGDGNLMLDAAGEPIFDGGHTTTHTYDGRDLLHDTTQQVRWPNRSGEARDEMRVTRREYHDDGRLDTITSPRGMASDAPGDFVTTMTYDGLGQLASRSLPQHEHQYPIGAASVTYVRDAVGHPRTITDANGNGLTNTFFDGGGLRSTTRPSFWIIDGPDASPRERTAQEMAQLNAPGELPDSTEQGDFGAVEAESFKQLLPRRGLTTLDYDNEMRLTRLSVTHDPDGATAAYPIETDFGRDALGRITSIARDHDSIGALDDRDNARITTTTQYDRNGNVRYAFDGEGNRTELKYDQYARVHQEIRPGSTATATTDTTTYGYDPNGNRTSTTTPVNTVWQTRYDDVDRLVREQTPAMHAGVLETTCHGYDVAGNPIWERSPRGNMPGVPGAPVDPAECGPSEPATTDDCRPTGYEDDDAPATECFTTRRTFNGADELAVERNGLGDETRFGYDRNGNRTTVDAPGATDNGTDERQVTVREFDGRDLAWTQQRGTGDHRRVTVTEFDGNGNLVREVRPRGVDATSGLPSHAWNDAANRAQNAQRNVFDADNLLVRRELPWNDDDRETGRFAQSFGHDDVGRVERIIGPHEAGTADAPARAVYRHYDTGWVQRTTEPETAHPDRPDTTVGGGTSTYEYDRRGNQELWTTHARGHDRRQVDRDYYPSGQLSARTARDLFDEAGDGDDGQRRYDYEYDGNRRMTAFVDQDRNGERTEMRYDVSDRRTVVRQCWVDGRRTWQTHDADGNVVERRTEGRWTQAGCKGLNIDREKYAYFAYDALGQERRTRVTRASDNQRRYETRWWPSGDRRSRRVLEANADGTMRARRDTTYTYADDGRLVRKTRDPATGSTEIRGYEYDPNGNRRIDRREDRIGQPANAYAYSARDQVETWTRRNGSRVEYDYNGAGTIVHKRDEHENSPIPYTVATQSFAVGDRVEQSRVRVTSAGVVGDDTWFNFDHSETGAVRRIYEPQDHTDPASPSVDQSQDVQYEYDAFDRMIRAQVPGASDQSGRYEYDALDRRISETRGGVRSDLHYVGLSESVTERERRPGDETVGRTIYDYDSQGERLGFRSVTQQTDGSEDWANGVVDRSYSLSDNGSVEGLEGDNGEIATDDPTTTGSENEAYEYDPYGAPDATQDGPDTSVAPADEDHAVAVLGEQGDSGLSTVAQDNPYRFQGHPYDSASATYDMRARTYRPSVGRFLVADRFESASGDLNLQADPITANRYAFAGGNPINRIEFDGHEPAEGSYKNAPDSNMYGKSSRGEYGRRYERAEREDQSDHTRQEAGVSTPDAMDRNAVVSKQVERGAAQSRVARETFEREVQRQKEESEDGVMGVVHTSLDVAGMVPLIGEPADLANAGLYAAEGNELMAGLSLAGAVPFAGWAATGAKFGIRGTDALKSGERSFDTARREAFERAGLTDPDKVEFTRVDPETGTVVEFRGPNGERVGYDRPHPDSPGPHHDRPHVSWQGPGKRRRGGRPRGNIPYSGPQHPSRSGR